MKRILLVLFLSYCIVLPVNAGWVKSYVKRDGTLVSGHWRSPKELGTSYLSRRSTPSYLNSPSYIPANLHTYNSNCKNSVITTEPEISIPQNYTYTHNSTEKDWFDIYKKAAILNGDLTFLEKAKYISQFQESEILWAYIKQEFIFCREEACFIKWMSEKWHWDSINKKVDNLYNYVRKK